MNSGKSGRSGAQKLKKAGATNSSPLSADKEFDDRQDSSGEEGIGFDEVKEDEEDADEEGNEDEKRTTYQKRRSRASRQLTKDMYTSPNASNHMFPKDGTRNLLWVSRNERG